MRQAQEQDRRYTAAQRPEGIPVNVCEPEALAGGALWAGREFRVRVPAFGLRLLRKNWYVPGHGRWLGEVTVDTMHWHG